MENLIEAIRNAVVETASDETRATGAQACRTILTALETKLGDPLAMPASQPPPNAGAGEPAAQIAQALGALRGIPAEQLLDLAIARLRAALPTGTEVPHAEPLKFHIVQLPPKVRK